MQKYNADQRLDRKWQIISASEFVRFTSVGYLDESGLVAEAVVAVLAHAVEVGLVLAVVAVRELAVLVEPAGDQGERRQTK